MKKIALVLIIAIVALSSCSKGSTPESSVASAVKPSAEALKASAFVMLNGLSLWTRDGDAAVYVKTSTLADAVAIEGEPVELEYKGNKREYSKVTTADGGEYFARTPYLVKADRLAVVRDEKCVLYNEPRVVGATTTIVPRLTVVAVVDPTLTEGFIKVSYAKPLPDGSMVVDKWIKRESIVDGAVDVKAAVAVAVVEASGAKEKDLKINILEGAISSFSASVFVDDLTNMLLALKGRPIIDLVSEKAMLTVNSNDVNVRSSPSIEGSDSLGKLNTGDVVESIERTSAKIDVKGTQAYWFHIVSPMDGWVFGEFLE